MEKVVIKDIGHLAFMISQCQDLGKIEPLYFLDSCSKGGSSILAGVVGGDRQYIHDVTSVSGDELEVAAGQLDQQS